MIMRQKDKSFAQRLKHLRTIKGLKQTEVASLIGVSYSSYQDHEGGAWHSRTSIQKYIDFYQCKREWLENGIGEPWDVPLERLPELSAKIINRVPSHDAGTHVNDFCMIPVAEARLNAGGGNLVISERMSDYYAFRNQWVHKIATAVNNMVMMFVDGDSMSPTIESGDVVMIDRGRVQIKPGCLYALGIGDTILIKRLDPMFDGRVQVISDNKTEYAIQTIPAEDLRVIGQVVWFARELIRLD
jgi:phage repressor protein C with HTH and peptisase S24 domain/DNA-binding XRE family transcriptional regulator